MKKYIIFENNLEINNNQIKSWAPIKSNKRPNGFYTWHILKEIKKDDIIYFITNTKLLAKGKALNDGCKCNFNLMYLNELKSNPDWSNEGFGVVSEVIDDYSAINIIINEKLAEIPNLDKNMIKPFEIWNNDNIRAHTGGYCYELSSSLENIFINILNNYEEKVKEIKLNDNKFKYNPITLDKLTKYSGTDEINDKKNKKGKLAENKVLSYFSQYYNVEDISNNPSTPPADLKITINNKEYFFEIKNISNQVYNNYFFISDSELAYLCSKHSRLCLYFNGNIYLSKCECYKSFFENIKNNFNAIRENVILNFDGMYQVENISILVNNEIIEKNFIHINPLNIKELTDEITKDI